MNRCPTCLRSDVAADTCPDAWHQEFLSPSKTVAKWADPAMFVAQPIDESVGPEVFLMNMTPDPLGSIAAAAKMYEGKVITSLDQVTHAEREYYLAQMQKTKIAAPLEFVQFHFLFRGVTRAWANQLVRQRIGVTYVQESLRFAVKEDLPVGLPPSLANTTQAWFDLGQQEMKNQKALEAEEPSCGELTERQRAVYDLFSEQRARLPKEERWRARWDKVLDDVHREYNALINDGMPAEDARGLLPLNTLTVVHWNVNLRALLEAAGNRLCTQAQFEWRLVFAKLAAALRAYDPDNVETNDTWQTAAIADLLRPVCYQVGKCVFGSDVDRKCSLRERVQARAMHGGVDSSQWHKPFLYEDGHSDVVSGTPGRIVTSPGIDPAEWLLDPGAAR